MRTRVSLPGDVEEVAHRIERPTDRYKKADHGSRRVRDPITGTEIIVKDADPKGTFTKLPFQRS
jgi:hypothetical protein